MIGNKYCLRIDETELFVEIVKRSYGMQEIEMCMKMGFVPIVVDEVIGEEVVIRVPSSRVTFKILVELLMGLEKIGGEEMTAIQTELWRVRRSLEILKESKVVKTSGQDKLVEVSEVVKSEEKVEDVVVECVKEERVVERTIDRIKVIDEKVRKIREYASGAVICDDGRERWINAEWTQTCEYVLTPE